MRASEVLNQALAAIGYQLSLNKEVEKPLIYIRISLKLGIEIHDNYYKDDAHPNNKYQYKKGESKGRMIGLEEAGWKGFVPVLTKLQ
jgi:hypothetical protein